MTSAARAGRRKTMMTKLIATLWANHCDALLGGLTGFATTAIALIAGHHFHI
jgi:hypothetical protein